MSLDLSSFETDGAPLRFLYSCKILNMLFLLMVMWLFQEVGGSISVRCPKGKQCESKCGDTIHFNLADQGTNQCKYFKLPAIMEEGRRRYKLDQYQWTCSNNHVNEGVEDGKRPLHAVYVRRLLRIGVWRIFLLD